MKTKKIIDLTFDERSSYPIYPEPTSGVKTGCSKNEIFEELERRFEKSLIISAPRNFHLASVDPGSGKTSFLAQFIKDLKSSGRHRDRGILLCFDTLREIDTFINICGLDKVDYAVYTSDSTLSAYGLGLHRYDDAWVLFTTHQMIRHHAGASFEETEKFHFKGKPRHLRVWDEGLSIADPVSIRLDDVGRLYADLRLGHEAFVEDLEKAIPSSAVASIGDAITIPTALKFPSQTDAEAVFGKDDPSVELLRTLSKLRGQELEVGQDNRRGKVLMGYRHELPADFAPVFILDGSGRLKHSYTLHQRHRGNLYRLPSLTHDYASLTINWWNRASGKTNLSDPIHRDEIVEAVASKIVEDEEDWLVIIHKDDEKARGYSLEKLISGKIAKRSRRVKIIHWGNHRATNEYIDIKRVMIVSPLRYSESAYGALYKAQSRLPVATADPDDLSLLKRSEMQDHILQGVARSSVRKIDSDGKCGDAEVYIIGPAGSLNKAMLEETFPGCSVVPWTPVEKPLSKQAARVVEEIKMKLAGGIERIPKKFVSDALGLDPPALSRHLKKDGVKRRLKALHISTERWDFVKT